MGIDMALHDADVVPHGIACHLEDRRLVEQALASCLDGCPDLSLGRRPQRRRLGLGFGHEAPPLGLGGGDLCLSRGPCLLGGVQLLVDALLGHLRTVERRPALGTEFGDLPGGTVDQRIDPGGVVATQLLWELGVLEFSEDVGAVHGHERTAATFPDGGTHDPVRSVADQPLEEDHPEEGDQGRQVQADVAKADRGQDPAEGHQHGIRDQQEEPDE